MFDVCLITDVSRASYGFASGNSTEQRDRGNFCYATIVIYPSQTSADQRERGRSAWGAQVEKCKAVEANINQNQHSTNQ